MKNLDFQEKIDRSKERMICPEQALGLGLLQQSNITNSGSRKILSETQRQQIMPLMRPERQIVGTGYEEKIGDLSSSIHQADQDYRVIARISKFSFAQMHHYWLILVNDQTKTMKMEERISYRHITESYGYLNDNRYLDSLQPGDIIPKDQIIRKSLSYDDDMNRCDGKNLNLLYCCLDKNMEDSIIISDDVGDVELVSPLINPVQFMINENIIPVNIYGNDEIYKSIPDIGQRVRDDGILVDLRVQMADDSPFTESNERLKQILPTDDTRKLSGIVLDIDVECNNVERLRNDPYAEQYLMYYEEQLRVDRELLAAVTPYLANGYSNEDDYDLQEMIGLAKMELNESKYVEKNNKPFSYMQVKLTVLKELPMGVGDKMTNMYGAKGVVSHKIPKELMPYTESGERVQVIMNAGGMCGRENVAQSGELSYTYIGKKIIEYIKQYDVDVEEALQMIIDYYGFVAPLQKKELEQLSEEWDMEEKQFYVNSVLEDGHIDVRAKPVTEAFDIFKLQAMYKRFHFIKQEKIFVPMKNSNGEYRFVEARRPVVMSKQYFWRLKQFAEEKFSATSLSSTNIRNQNTKSKASKNFKEVHSDTPIRAGNMEIDQLSSHIGAEVIVANLMIHSVSPHARRLTEQFYTHDPYNTDIMLDEESRNRSAEEVETYFKTCGIRMKFCKVKRRTVRPLAQNPFQPIGVTRPEARSPFQIIKEAGFDFVKAFEQIQENEKHILRESPFYYF